MNAESNKLKLILLGDYGVGKSAFFRRFVDNSFIGENCKPPTVGLDCFSKRFSAADKAITVRISRQFVGKK